MDLYQEELDEIKSELKRLKEDGRLKLRDNYNGIGRLNRLSGRLVEAKLARRDYFTFPIHEIPYKGNKVKAAKEVETEGGADTQTGLSIEIYWENLLYHALVNLDDAPDETILYAVQQYSAREIADLLYQILTYKLEVFSTQTEKCLAVHQEAYPVFSRITKPEAIALAMISQYEKVLSSENLGIEVLSHVSLGRAIECPFLHAVQKILKDYLWQMDPKTYANYGRPLHQAEQGLPALQKVTITKPVEELGYLLHLLHEQGYFKRGITKKTVVDAFRSILITENSTDLKSLLSYTSPSKSRGNTQERVKETLIELINKVNQENR